MSLVCDPNDIPRSDFYIWTESVLLQVVKFQSLTLALSNSRSLKLTQSLQAILKRVTEILEPHQTFLKSTIPTAKYVRRS